MRIKAINPLRAGRSRRRRRRLNREICEAHLSLSRTAEQRVRLAHFAILTALPPDRARKRETCARFRIQTAAAIISACILAACAPTIRMDAPGLPAISAPQPASESTNALSTEKEKIAPLDPLPQLPDALQAPCPLGSGLAACFTLDQDLVRQKRFKILHDDRDYCRDAYERARERANEQRLAQ